MSIQREDIAMPKGVMSGSDLLPTFSCKQSQLVATEQQRTSHGRPSSLTPDILFGSSKVIDTFLILLCTWLALLILDFGIPDIGIAFGFLLLFNIAIILSQLFPAYPADSSTASVKAISGIGFPLVLCSLIIGLALQSLPVAGSRFSYWIICSLFFSFPILIFARFTYNKLIYSAIDKNIIRWNIALCGTNTSSLQHLIEYLEKTHRWKSVVAVFTDLTEQSLANSKLKNNSMSTLEESVRAGGVDEVIVFFEDYSPAHRQEVIDKLSILPIRITLHYEIEKKWLLINPQKHCYKHHLIELTRSPLHGWRRLMKRFFDIITSSIALLIASPIMLLISLLIKIDSPGPSLFIQPRYGFNSKIINVMKFRSMYHNDSGERKFQQARKNDSRVTRIGSFLRKTSLDELPQLFNVLRGEMSIVGPRPHAIEMDEKYKPLIKNFSARYAVTPGITGWAQINGARGETPDIESMEQRFNLDRYYIANWTIWLDLKIVLLTATRMWNDKNAY